jgi:peptide/nickel transport system ATP-binding protein
MPEQSRQPLLQADAVTKLFHVGRNILRGARPVVRAVNAVSLQVYPGETLGLVGESGCGKSTLGRCLVRLYDIDSGEIRFDGTDISRLNQRALRPIRRRMQMVFQDPYASLNPRRRVGDLIAEPLMVHDRLSKAEVGERVQELLRQVDLSPDHATRFPHEFSGGQRQRIGIARALALAPRLIIADEPVSALDVSIQAQIVNLLSDLQDRLSLTFIFIAHDLSVVRHVSTRTAVMYLGSVVEAGPTEALFQKPAHPYSQALISAVPVPDLDAPSRQSRIVLGGEAGSALHPPAGCRFHPRCRFATARCRTEPPPLQDIGNQRAVACHFPLIN